MIFELKLDTKDQGDLAVLKFLFEHLRFNETDKSTETSPAEDPPKKKGRGRAKGKDKSKELTDSEIKDMDFDQMVSHLQHKDSDPTEYETRWFGKLFKKKHGGQDEIRAILNGMDAHNFIDLKKKDFKKFCTSLAEKDASLASDAEDDAGSDNDLDI